MKRIAIIIAALVALSVVGVLISAMLYDPKARVAEVEREITRIDGVELNYISDLEKQASQLVSAELEVEGKGRIGFTALSRKSFEDSTSLRLAHIGTRGFRSRQIINGRQAYGYELDIGPSSAISAVRSLNITSVQKAITHYDELISLTESWPIIQGDWPSTWPVDSASWSEVSAEEIRFVDPEGAEFFYCMKATEPSIAKTTTEQDVAPQSATRSESNSEGGDKPQPESKGRSR